MYVRRPRNTGNELQYTKNTVKYGAANVITWQCFSCNGFGPIHEIEGIMDQKLYVKILNSVMLPYAERNMSIKWVFQRDNDPKYLRKLAKEWFRVKVMEVMSWPAEFLDMNRIEYLWGDVKICAAERKPSNSAEL